MVKPHYIPERGDIIRISLDPTKGHEQAKTRPALVLSPRLYNQKASLCLCCPITSKSKGYPFEVEIAAGDITGVVLADQIRSLDWQARLVSKLASANEVALDQVSEKLYLLISNKP